MNTNIALIEETGLQVVEGKVVTTSRDVAEKFGKRHDNVLQTIENLECSVEFAELNFQVCFEINHLANGKKIKYYTLTRDAFTILAMGFTGKSAMQWKEKYIQAFNMMEQKILEDSKTSVSFENKAIKDLLNALIYDASRQAMKDELDSRFGDNVVPFTNKPQVMDTYNLEERITTEEYLDRRGEYDSELSTRLGQRCSAIARKKSLMLDKVPSRRSVNNRVYEYPVSIIREAYNQLFGV